MSKACKLKTNTFVGVSLFSPHYEAKARRLLASCERVQICCKATLLPSDVYGPGNPTRTRTRTRARTPIPNPDSYPNLTPYPTRTLFLTRTQYAGGAQHAPPPAADSRAQACFT